MSTYSLVRRGVISLTSADAGTSKDVDISGAVKTGSAIVVSSIRSNRKPVKVQRGQIAVTEAATSPANAAITAVAALAQAYVVATVREKRAGGIGATVKLSAVDQVRLEWLGGALGAGEDIVAEFEVVEHLLTRQAATIRLLDVDTVRVEWDTALEAGETITVSYEVYDVEDLGDSLQEILFRLQKMLAIQGENSITDLHTYDDAGNPTQFRVRAFDTKDDAEAATIDLPAGDALQGGELSRYLVTLDWSTAKNRPLSILSVRTHLLTPTPGVS
jgi:hypothetical protein